MIENLDTAVRLVGIGATLMIMAQMMASDIRLMIKGPLVGALIGAVGYLVVSSGARAAFPVINSLTDLVSISTPFFIWLFARALFERDPDRRVILIAALLLVAAWVLKHVVPGGANPGFWATNALSLALVGDLVRVALSKSGVDVVEPRRAARRWLALLAAILTGLILGIEVMEVTTGTQGQYPLASLFTGVAIVVLVLFAGLVMVRANSALLIQRNPSPASEREAAETLDQD
ncbi:MAG: hypothetical protein AAFQ90_12200 [Pseudomonadota bacterium]